MRLHVVQRTVNPLLWRLLDLYGQLAPAPMLVNPSFNVFGEPLVVSPRDAVRSCFCSGIDALIIGNFSLQKSWPCAIRNTPHGISASPRHVNGRESFRAELGLG